MPCVSATLTEKPWKNFLINGIEKTLAFGRSRRWSSPFGRWPCRSDRDFAESHRGLNDCEVNASITFSISDRDYVAAGEVGVVKNRAGKCVQSAGAG